MAVELKELCDYLDISPDSEWDEAKAKIDETFIQATPDAVKANKKLYGSLLGNINGAFVTRLRKGAEALDVELTKDEIEATTDTVELIDLVTGKIKKKIEQYPTKLKELEDELVEAKKKGASAKDIEKLTTDIEKWEKKYGDLEQLHSTTVDEFDTYKSQVAEEKQSFVINGEKQKAREAVKLNTKSDYERKGFFSEVDSKYKLDIDGDETIVRDSEGNRVKNPKKAGAFMSYTDVLQMEAEKAGLLNDNPHDGKEIKKTRDPVIRDDEKNDNPKRRTSALKLY